jgi:outer membrane lipoprotein carrier protein
MKKNIFLLLFSLPLFGDLSNIETFQANFEQVVTSDGDTIFYEGILKVKQPNFVLWQYEKPVQKSLYLNGKKIYLLEPELEQVVIRDFQNNLKLLEILKNAKQISEERYIAIVDEKRYLLIVTDELEKVIYQDEIDNWVVISFFNQIRNAKIDNLEFRPDIPVNFDRIYQ